MQTKHLEAYDALKAVDTDRHREEQLLEFEVVMSEAEREPQAQFGEMEGKLMVECKALRGKLIRGPSGSTVDAARLAAAAAEVEADNRRKV